MPETKPDKVVEKSEDRLTYYVAPSPHIADSAVTTKRMMLDVILGLLPVLGCSLYFFHWYAVVQIGLCVLTCLTAEALFTYMRGMKPTLNDYSAAVTGVILGLSLPWSAPWYVSVIGSVMAIGIGKVVFGGLGYNLFNPAMVGRAFIMLSFAQALSSSSYAQSDAPLALLTQATPLTAIKMKLEGVPGLGALFFGFHNGSLGETSILACLIGGFYLCIRRSASWEIPLSVVVAVVVTGGIINILGISPLTVLTHLTGGALIFGAFFIATDPVSSPLTPKGKFIFGLGVGVFTVLIRVFSSYSEGVMFAVLIMNATVPLINRWTIPRPLGLKKEKQSGDGK